MNDLAVNWATFAAEAPELATYAADRLAARPCYLATIRGDGTPRVHPVTPIVAVGGGLFLFTEPTSPKRHDLDQRRVFALHNGVPDNQGSGGELSLRGIAQPVTDPEQRQAAVAAAPYEPADRYLLFHLLVTDVRANAHGDITTPTPTRWPEPTR